MHLPDARVALVHARISLGAQGAVMEAVEQRFVHNDREVSGATLAVGDYVEVGPFLLHVEQPPEDVPLALSLRLSKRVAAKGGTMARRALQLAPRLSKRRLSYLAFFGTLLVALVAPIAADYWGERPMKEEVKALATGFSEAWNPGELARAHHNFSHDCRACHQEPFVQVQDRACLACHGTLREHVPPARLSGKMAMTLAETRCAECHRDHKGETMAPRSHELCASCHADVQHAAAGPTGVRNVSDFGNAHPHFRLTMVDAGQKQPRRVRQGEGKIQERSGLKFNHVLHMDASGIRSPQGSRANVKTSSNRSVLECDSCHQLDAEGVRMRPIEMEKHCSSCHELAFEPSAPNRQAPHGELEAVEQTLREFYARLVLGDVPADVKPVPGLPRMRPGAVPTPQERRAALRVADAKARQALRELVTTRKVCSTCHEISQDKNSWRITPVSLTREWMPGARFRHDKHATATCASCHDVRTSHKAEDVAMPDIARCRDCHGGAKAAAPKVASDCALCHVFHGGKNAWK